MLSTNLNASLRLFVVDFFLRSYILLFSILFNVVIHIYWCTLKFQSLMCLMLSLVDLTFFSCHFLAVMYGFTLQHFQFKAILPKTKRHSVIILILKILHSHLHFAKPLRTPPFFLAWRSSLDDNNLIHTGCLVDTLKRINIHKKSRSEWSNHWVPYYPNHQV